MLLAILLSILPAGIPDEICLGMPVKEATRKLAALDYIMGVEPVSVRITTCGGGLGSDGEPIAKWSCLAQTWAVSKQGVSGTLHAAYSKENGVWRLASVRMCFHNMPEGTSCMTPEMQVCSTYRSPHSEGQGL